MRCFGDEISEQLGAVIAGYSWEFSKCVVGVDGVRGAHGEDRAFRGQQRPWILGTWLTVKPGRWSPRSLPHCPGMVQRLPWAPEGTGFNPTGQWYLPPLCHISIP